MFNIGDAVAVIHEAIEGVIVKITKQKITIEDTDGFSRIFNQAELVIRTKSTYNIENFESTELINEKLNHSIHDDKDIVVSKKHQSNRHANNSGSEIDLHIEELVEDFYWMSNGEILQKQMMACRMFIERAIDNKETKVVLIHGKGEGVLKSEIHSYLNRLDDTKPVRVFYQQANGIEYGHGATEVNLKY